MSELDDSQQKRGKKRAELTATAIVLGVGLSLIMGAANVYLGLKAGMTVSASIPAAVIAMGALRGIFGRSSILESNLVQTSASAGESLAAGIIFTMPALILAGIWTEFDYWTTTLIALAGGLLGVLLMIPMRRVFVVEDKDLKYPEGLACAEVLRAGAGESESSTGVRSVLLGLLVGALFKGAVSFLGVIRGAVEAGRIVGGRVLFFGCDISPALVSVGFIVGLPIAIQIFLGGAIGWLVGIPLLGTEGVESKSAVETAWDLWSTKIRYVGVGAMLVGGVASIWRVRTGLVAAAQEMRQLIAGNESQELQPDTERNLSGGTIAALGIFCVLLIAALYYQLLSQNIVLTVLTTVVMLVMSFFFSAVASYIVGLVGNSNSPVSGMTITAVLGTGALVYLCGFSGEAGMVATLGVAGVVCCVACTSGDVCNDLKTGVLVGASPRNQQWMQVLGVGVAAFVMAPVMTVLHEGNAATGGIGGRELSAPQATLFASLANGFFGDKALPTDMVLWGVGLGILLLAADALLIRSGSGMRLYVMPVAVGIYLPLGLSVPILFGGLLSWLVARLAGDNADAAQKRGVLLTSGIIAGESILGVVLGFAAYRGIKPWEPFSEASEAAQLGLDAWSLLALLGVGVLVMRTGLARSDASQG